MNIYIKPYSKLFVDNGKCYKKKISIIDKSKESIHNFIFSLNKISYFFIFRHSFQILPSELTIILPYYKNGSIQNIIPLQQDESTIIEIIKSITKQIVQLHSIYQFHGRLKSSNILITDTDEYIITNYCEYMINDNRYSNWRDRFYESPEVYRNKELMNDKSDVYSIGVIFYELLNEGELPILGVEMKNNKYISLICKLIESDYRKRISAVELLNELKCIEKKRIEQNSDLFCLLLSNKYELEDRIVEKSIEFNEKNLIRITNDLNNSDYSLYAFVLLKLSWKNSKWKEIIDSTIDRKVSSNVKDFYFSSKRKYGLNLSNKNRLLNMMKNNTIRITELKSINYYGCLLLFSSKIYEQFYILRNLKYINMSKTSSSYLYITRFTNQLHYFTHLKSLKISYNRIDNKTFGRIMKNCGIMKELEMLYLTGNNLNNNSIRCFYHYAYKFPNLKLIGLCKNRKIKVKSVKLLLYEKMKRNEDFNFMVDISSTAIFDLLYYNGYVINKGNVFKSINRKTIQHIIALFNKAEDKNELFIILYILSFISEQNLILIKPHVEALSRYRDLFKGIGNNEMIYPNTLMDKKSYDLIMTICERAPKILKMDMYNTYIDDDTLYKILNNKNINRLKHVKYLDFSCNRLGRKSINKLFSLFSTFQNLTFFGFSDNCITSNCVDGFIENIRYLISIHHIFLGNNNFSEEGTNRLLQSLTCCTTLDTLSIQRSNVTDKSCKLLNQLLKKLPMIYYLKLNRNRITDKGIYNLFYGITTAISLKILDLCDNYITENALKYMFYNTYLDNLTDVSLSGNPIKRDDELYLHILDFDDKYTDIEDILSDFRGETKLTVKNNKVISLSPNLIHELVGLYKSQNRNEEYFRIMTKVIFENPYSSTRNNFLKEFDSNKDEFKMIEGIIADNSLSYNYSNTISENNLPFIMETLSYNTFLTSLSLNYITVSDDLFTKLVVKLQRMNRFRDLDIYGCGIGDENVSLLFNSLSSLTSLKTMYINYNNFTHNCIESLSNFEHLKNLQKLVMSGNYLGTDALNMLFISLTSLKILDTICISYSGFTDDNFEYLSKLMKSLKKLIFLNLRKNSITEKGIKYLFSSFDELDVFPLKELYLCDNNINEEGLSSLFDGINKHFRNLKCLYLSGNVVKRVNSDLYEKIIFYDKDYVDDRKIDELSNNITSLSYYHSTAIVYSPERLLKCLFEKYNMKNYGDNNKYLFLLFNAINKVTEWNFNTKSYILECLKQHDRELEAFKGANEHYKLIYDNLSNEGLMFLVECVKYISDLSIFKLKNTHMDDKVFISLINEMKRLISLKEIDFSNIGVGDEGMVELFKIFKNIISTKYLNISHNKFTHKIMSIFTEEVYNLNKLIKLDVSYNNLQVEGCMFILNAIEYLPLLREINMNETGFSDRNCKKLSELLKILDLKKIYINDNEITDDGAEILLYEIKKHLYLNICEIKNNKMSKELSDEFEDYMERRMN